MGGRGKSALGNGTFVSLGFNQNNSWKTHVFHLGDFSFGSYLRGGSFSADELIILLLAENNEIGYICVMSKAVEMAKSNVMRAPPLSSALLYGYYWVTSIVS